MCSTKLKKDRPPFLKQVSAGTLHLNHAASFHRNWETSDWGRGKVKNMLFISIMLLITVTKVYPSIAMWYVLFCSSHVALVVRTCLPKQEMKETQIQSLSREDPLEEGMETHFSFLSWRIPWTEESDGLWSVRSQRDRLNWSPLACMNAYIHCSKQFIKMNYPIQSLYSNLVKEVLFYRCKSLSWEKFRNFLRIYLAPIYLWLYLSSLQP